MTWKIKSYIRKRRTIEDKLIAKGLCLTGCTVSCYKALWIVSFIWLRLFSRHLRLWGLPRVFEKWPATPRCSWPAAWAWRPCIWSSWLRAPLDPLHLRHQARCQVLSCQEHQAWRTMAWSRLLCALEVAWCLALCCWPSDSLALLMWKMWWSLCLNRTWRLSGHRALMPLLTITLNYIILLLVWQSIVCLGTCGYSMCTSDCCLPFQTWGGREGQDHHLDQGASGSWQAFVYRGLCFLPCRRRYPHQPERWPGNWGVEWCPAKPSNRRGIGGLPEQSYHLWWTQGLVDKQFLVDWSLQCHYKICQRVSWGSLLCSLRSLSES